MNLQLLGHAIIATQFWFGCWYDWYYVIVPKEYSNFGINNQKLHFLTFWNAVIQSTFFTICFVNDLIGTNEKHPRNAPLSRKIKDIVLPCLSFPLGMYVGITFWSLYIIDRELVLPKFMDQFFPWWLNHLMHTNVMIFAIYELLVYYRKYPSRKVGITIFITFMLTYLAWLHCIYLYTNKWVYPLFAVLSLPARIVFFVGNLMAAAGFYLVGEKLNDFWWESYHLEEDHEQ